MKAFSRLSPDEKYWLSQRTKGRQESYEIAEWIERHSKIRAANIAQEIAKDILKHIAANLNHGRGFMVPAIEPFSKPTKLNER